MRDLKSAQKLKSAYSTSKSSVGLSPEELTYRDRKNSIHSNAEAMEQAAAADQTAGKDLTRRMSVCSNVGKPLIESPLPFPTKVKRSQTFAATLPRNHGKVRSSILEASPTESTHSTVRNYNSPDVYENVPGGDNLIDHSTTNSQFSFYNETRNYSNYEQGICDSLDVRNFHPISYSFKCMNILYLLCYIYRCFFLPFLFIYILLDLLDVEVV